MSNTSPMELYARRVERDAAIARRRSLARRIALPLLWKYVHVVPSVFSARGDFSAIRLRVPACEARERLRDSAVLTLDSATEILGGFRFGRNANLYSYFESSEDLELIARSGIGERRPGTCFPMSWSPAGWELLFAVVPPEMPPHFEAGGFRVVSRGHLVRDLIGFYGPRTALCAEIEAKLGSCIEGARSQSACNP